MSYYIAGVIERSGMAREVFEGRPPGLVSRVLDVLGLWKCGFKHKGLSSSLKYWVGGGATFVDISMT